MSEFKHRHGTIRPGHCYAAGYEPMRLLDGQITTWLPGTPCLTTNSDPPNVTAVYKNGSVCKIEHSEYDNVFNLYWPRPDVDYQ